MIAGDTVIRVSLKRLGENLDRFRALVGEKTSVMAVVKANGYGHGAVAIAPTLLAHGATYLAVARIEEALPLRQALPEAPLFVLGYTPDRLLPLAVEHHITLTIFTPHQAKLLGQAALEQKEKATVHLKVESGFNRLGSDNIAELLEILETPGIYAEGIYSHLALKDRPSDELQLSRFLSAVEALEAKGHRFRYRHIADSISAVDYPDFRLDMVRPGALLYGMVGYEDRSFSVQPVMELQTRIARLRKLQAGEGVGYDLAWVAERESLIATLPFGYADGVPRALGSRGYVLIQGHRCPLIGIMCMDQCVADVTDVPNVAEGDLVTVYGNGSNSAMTVADAAAFAATNKNEILCRLTARPVRIYE